MKEAITTDLSGRYIEPTLVADSVTGVFDRREPVEPDEPGILEQQPEPVQRDDDGQEDEPETVLVGYTVAVPMPDGPALYRPVFDVAGYRAAMEAYEAANAEYMAALAEHDPESDEHLPEPPQLVDGPSYWRNGLTDEEIEAMNPPPEPSAIDLLGAMLVQRELEALDLRTENQALGAQVVAKDLQIYDLKAQTGAQGANLVGLDVRVHELEAKTDV